MMLGTHSHNMAAPSNFHSLSSCLLLALPIARDAQNTVMHRPDNVYPGP
jgi:hypothetical protein